MITMTKFSIITPSFNQGKFILKCIDSIKAQDGVKVEHIILDNCSTDGTSEVIDAYTKNPGFVSLITYSEKDSGQTNAINKGFRASTGDILCWINTDEYLAPGALNLVAKLFSEHPEVDFIFG